MSVAEDHLFRALADPARRQILDLLRERRRQTGELAEQFEVSRFMVMKHLKTLVAAGLVLVEREGRVRWNYLNPGPIQAIYRRWLEPFERAPVDAMVRLKALAEADAATPSQSPESPQSREPENPPMEEADFKIQEVLVEVPINASREKVWKTLVDDPVSWWPKDYYVNSDGARFTIDARVGGHMWEDWGDGEGTIWATITHVKRNEALRMSAELWPEYGGPARTIQRYDLVEQDGGTLLRFRDVIYGRVPDATVKSMTEGWEYLFGRAFKNYVEEGRIPPEKSDLSC